MRCNYYVSSGAYSPGVFNLILLVSQRDTHFFFRVLGKATPRLKLINQQGFTFHEIRTQAVLCVPPSVIPVGRREQAQKLRECEDLPLSASLTQTLPSWPPTHPHCFGGGLHLQQVLCKKETLFPTIFFPLNFGRIPPLINGIVKLPG